MYRKNRKRVFVYLLSAAIVLALTSVGVALALSSSNTPVKIPAASSASPVLSGIARGTFSVFAQPPAGAQDVSVIGEAIREPLADVDPTSVHLSEDTSGIQVRVAGDSQSVCLVIRIPGKAIAGSCAPDASAVIPATPVIQSARYVTEDESPNGMLAVAALFPDRTTGVTVTGVDGTPKAISVVNNTAAFVANENDTLMWTGPEGQSYSSSLPH